MVLSSGLVQDPITLATRLPTSGAGCTQRPAPCRRAFLLDNTQTVAAPHQRAKDIGGTTDTVSRVAARYAPQPPQPCTPRHSFMPLEGHSSKNRKTNEEKRTPNRQENRSPARKTICQTGPPPQRPPPTHATGQALRPRNAHEGEGPRGHLRWGRKTRKNTGCAAPAHHSPTNHRPKPRHRNHAACARHGAPGTHRAMPCT